MYFETTSDGDLLETTKRLAREEKRIGIEVLHHLQEIDARKLYATLAYPSLFAYCTQELGYSEGGAYRRISAMKILRDVPSIDAKLQSGAVSVATLSQVQSFLVQEKRLMGKRYTAEDKKQLLQKIEMNSCQQTQRLLATLSPQSSRIEMTRPINEVETEIHFTANQKLMEKIERLKSLTGHQTKSTTYAGLFEIMCDIALKKLDPLGPVSNIKYSNSREPTTLKQAKVDSTNFSTPSDSMSAHNSLCVFDSTDTPTGIPMNIPMHKIDLNSTNTRTVAFPPTETNVVPGNSRTRYLSHSIKKQIWRKAGGRCTYLKRGTTERCQSTHALQVEHIVPFAKGGANYAENLTLLCPAHNQLSAINAYGLKKMKSYW